MTGVAGELDPETGVAGALPRSARLVRLMRMVLPSLSPADERLEAALGPELTRFLVAALCADGQGRVLGSSSP
jgi:hypothetical protein